jgi:hypothetical protein
MGAGAESPAAALEPTNGRVGHGEPHPFAPSRTRPLATLDNGGYDNPLRRTPSTPIAITLYPAAFVWSS